MSTPKRHHFVPQLLLKNFTDDDGYLHWRFLSGRHEALRRGRPDEVFFENHLYSTMSEGGKKDARIEQQFLAVIESDAAPVVRTILEAARAGKPPVLADDQRAAWIAFFLTQWRRTPDRQKAVLPDAHGMEMLEEMLEKLRQSFPERSAEIARLSTESEKRRTLRNTRIEGLRQISPKVLAVLEQRGIAVLRIVKPRRSFIIASNPVAKMTSEGRNDLSDTSAEMWMPIASDVAVGIGPGSRDVLLIEVTDERPVRQINQAIARQSSAIAGCSAALVASVGSRR
jgi:hypothetical protein